MTNILSTLQDLNLNQNPTWIQEQGNYLNENGFEINKIHNPKLVTSMLLKQQDKILFMDLSIMEKIRNQYPKLSNRMQLFNTPAGKFDLSDPFLLNKDQYEEIMDNIHALSKMWKIILTQKP